ncbi:BON domain-containing protein [Methyloglobulus sp.]|uniref:BON domain-containing protein n=1 Tax=Methyloglobulus sp. TaxID=2518622 RepID=UPI00398A4233
MKTTKEYNQKFIASRILVMSCLSAVLGLAGCQPDGSSEKAGQRMDSAADNAEKTIEKSNKAANQQIEGLKDSLDKNAEQAKENIDQSIEVSKDVLEESKDKVDENSEQAKDKVDQIEENVEKKLDDIKDSTTGKSETVGEYIDDSVITTKVKAAILGSSWLGASHIEVTTNKGIVKLSGTVDSEQSIAKAIEVARSQENVKAVQTDLIVSVNASSKK